MHNTYIHLYIIVVLYMAFYYREDSLDFLVSKNLAMDRAVFLAIIFGGSISVHNLLYSDMVSKLIPC